MLMLWLLLMGTLELADLETQMTGMRLYICGCGVKAPSVVKRVRTGKVLTPETLTGVAMRVWSPKVS